MKRPLDAFADRVRDEVAPRAREAEGALDDVLRALRLVSGVARQGSELALRVAETERRGKALRKAGGKLRTRIEDLERRVDAARRARTEALLAAWIPRLEEDPASVDVAAARAALDEARERRRALEERRDRLRDHLAGLGVREEVLDQLAALVRERPETAERYLREFLRPRLRDARREAAWSLPRDVLAEVASGG